MSHRRLYLITALSTIFLSLSTTVLQAYTATDYYNAGLQLYNAKNYQQAVQYFSAAIQLDPNNTPSLQGRGNCYYALGQYPQALADYQKVQAINPNPQLASFIQNLQAKAGTGGNSALPGASPTGNSFSQGVALFQQRQYAQAVPLFQQATRENPNDSMGYYYLGICQLQSGDMKDAAVALGICNRIKPNPSVENYVVQLKSRLSPDDQQWVDGQITASATASAAGISSPGNPKNFGIRFEPALVLPSMGDFNAEAQSGLAYVKNLQNSNPNATYSASVPAGYPNIAVEPVLKLSPQFELGLPIAMGLVGNFTETVTTSSSSTNTITWAISAFSIGVNGRYLMSLGKDMDFFVAGGPLVVPAAMHYTISGSSGTADVSAIGFGGQIQLGLDYQLADSFVVGPFAGFQLASVSGFTGTDTAGGAGEVYIFTNPPASQWPNIFGVTSGSSPPSGAKPLTVDLSGPFAGIQVSGFF